MDRVFKYGLSSVVKKCVYVCVCVCDFTCIYPGKTHIFCQTRSIVTLYMCHEKRILNSRWIVHSNMDCLVLRKMCMCECVCVCVWFYLVPAYIVKLCVGSCSHDDYKLIDQNNVNIFRSWELPNEISRCSRDVNEMSVKKNGEGVERVGRRVG